MADDGKNAENESRRLKAAKKTFAEFLANNPTALIVEVPVDERALLAITTPWNDDSLAILITPENRKALSQALNNALLPASLTAIYHLDTRELEVIWTALKLSVDQEEIAGREFEFRRDGKAYKCSFSRSSDRLLVIAKGSMPLKQSDTNWRNLRSFHNYALRDEEEGASVHALDEPRSFWVKEVDWDEEGVLDLLRNLNFYLKLYDFSSPTVVIHPEPDPLSLNPRNRYLWDMFPSVITARNLEPNLVSYWAAAHDADSSSEQFLNFYRIVEYVAYHYVEHKTRREIKRVMSSPHLASGLERATNDVIALIREFRVQQEGQRVESVVREIVKPEVLWKEVCVNPSYFTAPVEFDGGLKIDKLANSATDPEDIPAQLVNNTITSMTKIRNALAHGKDKMTGDVVLPTLSNMSKLKPWVHLISVVAAEVLLYEKLD